MIEAAEGARRWRLDWPVSAGARIGSAHLKTCPEDFRVSEILEGFHGRAATAEAGDVSGEGEHLCLFLEKTGDNTEFVARELAALAGCRSFDVGFCGLKDRHAVTRQWFSLYRPGMLDDDAGLIEQVAARWPVIDTHRSVRKLRRGDHQGNRFVITLRQVTALRSDVEAALERLNACGAPNYFGPQRFGFAGGNLDRAVGMDPSTLNRRGGKGKRRPRGKARTGGNDRHNAMYFSAARAWLFNEVLASRVADGSWCARLPGEPLSYGTGPLWGDGGTSAHGELEQRERAIVARTPELAALFQATRMKPERRPLVAAPQGLRWCWLENDEEREPGAGSNPALQLAFALAPGQYATTLLSDVFTVKDLSKDWGNR